MHGVIFIFHPPSPTLTGIWLGRLTKCGWELGRLDLEADAYKPFAMQFKSGWSQYQYQVRRLLGVETPCGGNEPGDFLDEASLENNNREWYGADGNIVEGLRVEKPAQPIGGMPLRRM